MAASTTAGLVQQYCSVRQQSEAFCKPLTAEDLMVQSCAEASPGKWHLAHTSWFFETFILREYLSGYREFHPDFFWLFNSYYKTVSEHPEKKLRSSFSRPSLESILMYRRRVDSAIETLIDGGLPEEAQRRLILGLNHEQQHLELLATDIKHAFWTNPLHPAYRDEPLLGTGAAARPMTWIAHPGGLHEVGFSGPGFSFDNETPRHKEYLEPFEIASRPVNCAEYLEFMESGGYERPDLWLSEGWDTVEAQNWRAPLYWHREGGSSEWSVFTLRGNAPLSDLEATPVCHLSYFEADAFARWSGKRLPTEAEWEVVAAGRPVEGNLYENGALHPVAPVDSGDAPQQMFGDVWEWTRSPYVGYPGYRPLPGALGEYNGKFMCNQMVLRGGSAVTPASHIRAEYRNYFAPATRWQFSGLRLANG
jgi:ergothioneine biosynthesis protein EgtB